MPTNDSDAHGQVAWSWHPDAGVPLATTLTRRAGHGGQQARRTGEIAKQPSKPSRGECRDVSAEPVVPAACILLAGGPWVRPAPGIPRALRLEEGRTIPSLGRMNAPRDSERSTCRTRVQKAHGGDEQQRILRHRRHHCSTDATTAHAGTTHRRRCRVSAFTCSSRRRSGGREATRLAPCPALICITCRSSSAPCPRRPAAGILRWVRRDRNGSCCRPASARSAPQRSCRPRDRCRRGSGGACPRRRD